MHETAVALLPYLQHAHRMHSYSPSSFALLSLLWKFSAGSTLEPGLHTDTDTHKGSQLVLLHLVVEHTTHKRNQAQGR
jgi:hypothetical protein